MSHTLWIATRKGAFALRSDAARRSWKLSGPQFLGHIVHHIVQDPRDPKVVLMAAKTGHLGPTMYRSTDRGRKWTEVKQPPAFRTAADGEASRAVEAVSASRMASASSSTDPAGTSQPERPGVTSSGMPAT